VKETLQERGVSQDWWLGIHDKDNEGSWVYDSSNQDVTFFDTWANTQPDNYQEKEHYLEQHINGWNDFDSDSKNPVICEATEEDHPRWYHLLLPMAKLIEPETSDVYDAFYD